jgi:hypothetical protein
VKPLILVELLSLKIIGMPDAVNTSTAPSVERFRENTPHCSAASHQQTSR